MVKDFNKFVAPLSGIIFPGTELSENIKELRLLYKVWMLKWHFILHPLSGFIRHRREVRMTRRAL